MISNFFIKRPIVAIVIAIVTVIGGLVAMVGLPVAQFPDIVPPQIIVTTTYTGADAQLLPYDFDDFTDTVRRYVDEVEKLAKDKRDQIIERRDRGLPVTVASWT